MEVPLPKGFALINSIASSKVLTSMQSSTGPNISVLYISDSVFTFVNRVVPIQLPFGYPSTAHLLPSIKQSASLFPLSIKPIILSLACGLITGPNPDSSESQGPGVTISISFLRSSIHSFEEPTNTATLIAIHL